MFSNVTVVLRVSAAKTTAGAGVTDLFEAVYEDYLWGVSSSDP